MSAAIPPEPRFREDVRVARAAGALDPQEKVFTWPHLLSIELVAALLYTVGLSLFSIFVNAPLEPMANAQHTPNPSKAPWYFLGLQELLLHMHPTLAGVLVPGAVLVGLATIPYIDKERKGIGIWFATPRGISISLFTALFSAIWVVLLVMFDNWVGVRPIMSPLVSSILSSCVGTHASPGLIPQGQWFMQEECGAVIIRHILGVPDAWGLAPAWNQWIVPIAFMIGIPFAAIQFCGRYGRLTVREQMISLYAYFLATFLTLTVIMAGFRGFGERLYWPWQLNPFPD
jgi:menaquinol-cytochrome c reductase cytochrome b/c subunit